MTRVLLKVLLFIVKYICYKVTHFSGNRNRIVPRIYVGTFVSLAQALVECKKQRVLSSPKTLEIFRKTLEIFPRTLEIFRKTLEIFPRTLEIFPRTLEFFLGRVVEIVASSSNSFPSFQCEKISIVKKSFNIPPHACACARTTAILRFLLSQPSPFFLQHLVCQWITRVFRTIFNRSRLAT